jgi:glutamyl-tRNA synthetase
VGRLAPSPTGALHLGHARSFLLAFWSVRSQGGRLILRLEDLDVDRARPEYSDLARDDLEWLGIEWDEVRVQSRGLNRIRTAAFQLLERGLAYPCTCSRADIRALSAPHEPEGRYPGTCRRRHASLEHAERESGKLAGLRFRASDREVAFEDGVAGRRAVNVQQGVGDFLILRRDKHPAYHLSVVVDDARDGVTEVLRGDDLLDSTAQHLLLYEALAMPAPSYFHVPLVVDERGQRLAKRAPKHTLRELRERGADPQKIVAWVKASAGLDEQADPRTEFRIERLPRLAVKVDPERVRGFSTAANKVR